MIWLVNRKWSLSVNWVAALALASLSMVTRAQTIEYVHTDPLGSPVAITNQTGQIIERTEYEPYGQLIGSPANDRMGYAGQVMDSATGLTYMQQRYYDPAIGSFLSTDPVKTNANIGTSFNRYWYANNNPYRFTDSDGRDPQENYRGLSDPAFRDWVHSEKQKLGRGAAQNYTSSELRELHKEWRELGEPRGKGGRSSRGGSKRGQRGFFLPRLALKANIYTYLLFASGELNSGEDDRLDELRGQRKNFRESRERPKKQIPSEEPSPAVPKPERKKAKTNSNLGD